MTDERLAHALDGPMEAPVLVLSGSLGTTRAMWQPQVAALALEWRLVRIDHPGHGGSPVWNGPVTVEGIGRSALALLDELGYERASWCGLSLGAAAGQWVAAHAPERIERLILCCTSARFNAPQAYLERAATVRARGMAAVSGAVVARWFTKAFAESRPDLVAQFRSTLEAIPAEGYAACCEAVAGFDGRPDLATIAAPTLVLAGAEDRATPVEHARTLCAGIPGAELTVVAGAAHLANVERPEAVTEAIRNHLRAKTGRSRDA